MRPSELDSFSCHSAQTYNKVVVYVFSGFVWFSDLNFESKYDFPSKIDLQPGRDKLPLKNICCCWVVQSCLTATFWAIALQAPPSMGFSRPRIPEWFAISFSRGSSWPRNRTRVFCRSPAFAGRLFTPEPSEEYKLGNNMLFLYHSYRLESSSSPPPLWKAYNYWFYPCWTLAETECIFTSG